MKALLPLIVLLSACAPGQRGSIPVLDKNQSSKFETATFALG